MPRSVVTIDDLTNDEIEAVFQLADRFLGEQATPDRPYRMRGKLDLAREQILATLFFEASTRTRLSFESAMLRLGGQCLTTADASHSSAAKGETLADTVRVVENYADAIVIRHPLEGAARVAADYAGVPVINAGDGSHEHPTQTLCDLYTLRAAQAEKGRPKSIESLRDLNVMIWGDLHHGRTVHSLVYALARLKARIIPRAAPGCELPSNVCSRLARDYQCVAVNKEEIADGLPPDVDVVYLTPQEPHQLALFANLPVPSPAKSFKSVDALYSTRLQLERFQAEYGGKYPAVNSDFLKDKQYRDAKVMHPLPRVDELSYEIDRDHRSVYFQQAAYGVPVRMALIAALLEICPTLSGAESPAERRYPKYGRSGGIACSNERCVSRKQSEQRYLTPKYRIVDQSLPILRCEFCDFEQQPLAVGRTPSRKYTTDMTQWTTIPADELIFFATEEQAQGAGFGLKKEKPAKPREAAPAGA